VKGNQGNGLGIGSRTCDKSSLQRKKKLILSWGDIEIHMSKLGICVKPTIRGAQGGRLGRWLKGLEIKDFH